MTLDACGIRVRVVPDTVLVVDLLGNQLWATFNFHLLNPCSRRLFFLLLLHPASFARRAYTINYNSTQWQEDLPDVTAIARIR